MALKIIQNCSFCTHLKRQSLRSFITEIWFVSYKQQFTVSDANIFCYLLWLWMLELTFFTPFISPFSSLGEGRVGCLIWAVQRTRKIAWPALCFSCLLFSWILSLKYSFPQAESIWGLKVAPWMYGAPGNRTQDL